jgi:gas vesicle protein
MTDRDEFGAFLIGFVVGGLTGAVVALLFAPQSGEETRALIKEKSIELKDKVEVTAEEAYARAEQIAADARLRADELAKEVRTRSKGAVEAVRKPKKSDGGTPPLSDETVAPPQSDGGITAA